MHVGPTSICFDQPQFSPDGFISPRAGTKMLGNPLPPGAPATLSAQSRIMGHTISDLYGFPAMGAIHLCQQSSSLHAICTLVA